MAAMYLLLFFNRFSFMQLISSIVFPLTSLKNSFNNRLPSLISSTVKGSPFKQSPAF